MLKINKIALSLCVVSGIAFANPTVETNNIGSISKSDSEFLFKNASSSVVALSSNEMKTTEGKLLRYNPTLTRMSNGTIVGFMISVPNKR